MSLPEHRGDLMLLHAASILYARGYHRLKVVSPSRLPARGPAILVSNHISGLDPVLIQSACSRLIVWMMAREYYEQRGLRPLLRILRAIPVDRGGRDLAATRQALRALQAGMVLGVFPEGRLATSSDLLPFQTGAALMAQRSGAPLYPCAIEGTQRDRSMTRVYAIPQQSAVAFGSPIRAKTGESLTSLTGKLHANVDLLRRTLPRPNC